MSEKTERPFGVILAPLLSKVYHLCGFVRKKKASKPSRTLFARNYLSRLLNKDMKLR